MGEEHCKLTVFFEEPFWVGVFERIENGKLSAAKVTFGAEPKAANRSWQRRSACLNLGSNRRKQNTGADDVPVCSRANSGYRNTDERRIIQPCKK